MEAHQQYLDSDEHKQAVRASYRKSEDQVKLKLEAHALRQKLQRAKLLFWKVQLEYDLWYNLTENEQDLYWQFFRGDLEQEVHQANQDYGHSFATRDPGGSSRVSDIMQDLIRLPHKLLS
mgnify:CR=1 FL=1